jgi:signal transduction histidine kinase
LAFLGGTLAVESDCGLGTTIYVRIPLAGVAAPSWA